MKRKSHNSGFTLIELAVVMTVLVVLSGVISSFFIQRHSALAALNARYDMQQEVAEVWRTMGRDVRSALEVRMTEDGVVLKATDGEGRCLDIEYRRNEKSQLLREVWQLEAGKKLTLQDLQLIATGLKDLRFDVGQWPSVTLELTLERGSAGRPQTYTGSTTVASMVQRSTRCS